MAQDAQRSLIGRYRIGKLLGEGAVGVVWRGWDQILERDVALKMLKPAYAGDAPTVARFYAEARAAARLVHPQAVLVHDVVSEGARHAIVMEYVAGISLERVLASEGRLSEARAVRYARQIAHALAAAHAGGLLHRDVKPANVLITPEDGVKVADFGLAKAIADAEPSPSEAGRLIGSAAYVSPEQAQGFALTPASDLYSLGVVLHRMLTGRLPFEGTSPITIAVAHVTAPAPSAAELGREMSPALAVIVSTLLRKDPAERFTSANELITELARVDSGPRQHVPAWDADTDTALPRVRAERSRDVGANRSPNAPRDRSRPGRIAARVRGAVRVARTMTTALALLVVTVAATRVASDHHVTVNGLRHLTAQHAVHTALVELGLRPRPQPPTAATDAIATLGSDTTDGTNGGN